MLAALCLAGEARAQRAVEWRVYGIGVATGERFVGGGIGVGLRTAGRVRLATALAAGSRGGDGAVRGEASISYHLNPFKRRGVTPYVGGGAAVTTGGAGTSEFLLLHLGVEARPGARVGWFIEGGAGGGVRLVVGVRVSGGRPR